ncbi:MAG: hypothetical protein M1840_008269 [Geoglossum simile]|nr:MAG: hypothetical protein M1840_008269 [Geoglossum simile]
MLEVVSICTIVGASAALITAFESCATLFREWREKRKDKKLQNVKALSYSLARSPRDVSRERDHGLSKMGQRFARGDSIATNDLMRTLIRLNKTLTATLKASIARERDLDLMGLFKTSEKARMDTLSIMGQLLQRLHVQAPISQAPSVGSLSQRERQEPSETHTLLEPVTAAISADMLQNSLGISKHTAIPTPLLPRQAATAESLHSTLESLRLAREQPAPIPEDDLSMSSTRRENGDIPNLSGSAALGSIFSSPLSFGSDPSCGPSPELRRMYSVVGSLPPGVASGTSRSEEIKRIIHKSSSHVIQYSYAHLSTSTMLASPPKTPASARLTEKHPIVLFDAYSPTSQGEVVNILLNGMRED